MGDRDQKLQERTEELTLALQASEERFRNIVALSSDGIMIVDSHGIIRFVNPAVETIFNRPAQEILGEQFGYPISADQTTELDIFRKGALHVVVEMRVVTTEWEGAPATLVTLRDITERRRTEIEFRKLYRAVLQSPNMVLITDPHGLIEFVNPKFTEVTGYTLPEVAGKDPGVLKSGQEPAEVYQDLRKTIQTGQEWRGELVSRKKSGELFWQSVAISPITDPDGDVVNFVCVMEDITKRKQAEHALRREKGFTDAVINSMPGIFYVFDHEGRLLRWNSRLEDFSGHDPEKMHAMRPHEFVVRQDHGLMESKLCEVLVERRNAGAVLRLLDRGGQQIPFYCTGSPLTVDNATYLVGVGIDISERIQAEKEIERLNADLAARAKELEAANRELEAFGYTAAHDLRSPLNVISGYCQIVQTLCGERLDDTCREYLTEIYDGTMRMSELIDVLLRFSQLAHTEPCLETVDLSAVAHEIAAELQLQQPGRRCTFRILEGTTAYGDPKLLRVTLMNLLGNAWKYTGEREEGVIEFGTTESSGASAYFVRDNGSGFHTEDAEMLFTPFLRSHGSDRFKGFGIGLATVDRIIRRHGGRVWAEGEPDKGATFWFTLPPERGAKDA